MHGDKAGIEQIHSFDCVDKQRVVIWSSLSCRLVKVLIKIWHCIEHCGLWPFLQTLARKDWLVLIKIFDEDIAGQKYRW